MTTTVPADMLAEIQGWAPGGGFVRSEYRAGDKLHLGDLAWTSGGWSVIVGLATAVSKNAAGEILDKSPAVVWRDLDGNQKSQVLWACSGLEVRTDTRIDPATLKQS